MGRAFYCSAGERLLVYCYTLEAISDGEIPLDQGTNLLDHPVSVLRECVQYVVECLKARKCVQKVFHKLLLLLS